MAIQQPKKEKKRNGHIKLPRIRNRLGTQNNVTLQHIEANESILSVQKENSNSWYYKHIPQHHPNNEQGNEYFKALLDNIFQVG